MSTTSPSGSTGGVTTTVLTREAAATTEYLLLTPNSAASAESASGASAAAKEGAAHEAAAAGTSLRSSPQETASRLQFLTLRPRPPSLTAAAPAAAAAASPVGAAPVAALVAESAEEESTVNNHSLGGNRAEPTTATQVRGVAGPFRAAASSSIPDHSFFTSPLQQQFRQISSIAALLRETPSSINQVKEHQQQQPQQEQPALYESKKELLEKEELQGQNKPDNDQQRRWSAEEPASRHLEDPPQHSSKENAEGDVKDEATDLYYEHVSIREFEYEESSETFYFPCPCGDLFEIALAELRAKVAHQSSGRSTSRIERKTEGETSQQQAVSQQKEEEGVEEELQQQFGARQKFLQVRKKGESGGVENRGRNEEANEHTERIEENVEEVFEAQAHCPSCSLKVLVYFTVEELEAAVRQA